VALAEAVTPDDITAVVTVLVQEAKAGQSWAVRELLNRTLGRTRQSVQIEGAVQNVEYFPDDFLEYLDWKAARTEVDT